MSIGQVSSEAIYSFQSVGFYGDDREWIVNDVMFIITTHYSLFVWLKEIMTSEFVSPFLFKVVRYEMPASCSNK